MTLHIHYDHACSECGTEYIPFDDDIPCPKCGALESDRATGFVSRAADSALYNLEEQGSYQPMAWFAGSLGDHTLLYLFGLLESYRKGQSDKRFDSFAREHVYASEWGENEHLKENTYRLACRVHEEIERQNRGANS